MLCEICLCAGIVSSFSSKPKDKPKVPKPVGRSGTVTLYDGKKHNGLISGGKGDDYGFALVDWREDYLPQRGDKVTFVALGSHAKDIHASEAPNRKNTNERQSNGNRTVAGHREARPDAPKPKPPPTNPKPPTPQPQPVSPVKPYSKEGTVTEYSGLKKRGFLSGGEGDEYRFRFRDWRGDDPPTRGTAVKFVVVDNKARDVYPIAESKSPDVEQDIEETRRTPSRKSGLVIDYNGFRNRGYLSGGEGDEYRFRLRDWRGEEPPTRGDSVEFIVVGNDARDVFPTAESKQHEPVHEAEDKQHKPSDKSGLVIDYSRILKRGVISGGRGDDYHFKRRDWRGNIDPTRGDEVEFVAIGVHAKDIYPVIAADPDEVHRRFDAMEQQSEETEQVPTVESSDSRSTSSVSEDEGTTETTSPTSEENPSGTGRFDPEARYIRDLGNRMSAAGDKAGGAIGRFTKRWNRRN